MPDLPDIAREAAAYEPAEKVTADDVARQLQRDWFEPAETEYLRYHKQRIADTLSFLHPRLSRSRQTILDVGPHMLTAALHTTFKEFGVTIDTIGWRNDRLAPANIIRAHFQRDLTEDWSPAEIGESQYDGIVFAETIEHLHRAPEIVLRKFRHLLRPGGWLCIQTPNAVALTKRLKMLTGRNPFERIREDTGNPGHFREYTMSELCEMGQRCGFGPAEHGYMNYWRSRGWKGFVEDYCPSLRNALLLVLVRPPAD